MRERIYWFLMRRVQKRVHREASKIGATLSMKLAAAQIDETIARKKKL